MTNPFSGTDLISSERVRISAGMKLIWLVMMVLPLVIAIAELVGFFGYPTIGTQRDPSTYSVPFALVNLACVCFAATQFQRWAKVRKVAGTHLS